MLLRKWIFLVPLGGEPTSIILFNTRWSTAHLQRQVYNSRLSQLVSTYTLDVSIYLSKGWKI